MMGRADSHCQPSILQGLVQHGDKVPMVTLAMGIWGSWLTWAAPQHIDPIELQQRPGRDVCHPKHPPSGFFFSLSLSDNGHNCQFDVRLNVMSGRYFQMKIICM